MPLAGLRATSLESLDSVSSAIQHARANSLVQNNHVPYNNFSSLKGFSSTSSFKREYEYTLVNIECFKCEIIYMSIKWSNKRMKLICNVTGDEINHKSSIATKGPTMPKSNERFVNYFLNYLLCQQVSNIFNQVCRVPAFLIKTMSRQEQLLK